ncbi:MAG: retropepsin-like aspartic protease [Chitinophagales bacterium]|nr:retropepsin-like aspartic protease [Chitinophagales bacterium]
MKNLVATTILLVTFCSLFAQTDKSQYLYTSDKKLIGNKSQLIKECAAEMDEEGMDEAAKTELCECILFQMAAHLTYKDFNKMIEAEDFDFEKVFENKKHKEMANGVLECIFSLMQDGGVITSFRDEFMNECVKGFEQEAASTPALASVDATVYCSCMLEKILENKELTKNFMSQADDEDSPLIAEAALPCMLLAMGVDEENAVEEDSLIVREIDPITMEEIVTKQPAPKEKSADIKGDVLSAEVPLTRYLSAYTLKVKMGAVEGKFVLDSGASDILINKEFEKKLLDAGVLKKGDEVGEKTYALADGSKVKAKVYNVSGIQVGGFTVDNVMTGVISEDASLLLGKSFLDKFTRWEIDNDKKTLYLEK